LSPSQAQHEASEPNAATNDKAIAASERQQGSHVCGRQKGAGRCNFALSTCALAAAESSAASADQGLQAFLTDRARHPAWHDIRVFRVKAIQSRRAHMGIRTAYKCPRIAYRSISLQESNIERLLLVPSRPSLLLHSCPRCANTRSAYTPLQTRVRAARPLPSLCHKPLATRRSLSPSGFSRPADEVPRALLSVDDVQLQVAHLQHAMQLLPGCGLIDSSATLLAMALACLSMHS
jgi:hypothetical protein